MLKSFIKKVIPSKFFLIILPVYHLVFAFISSLIYRFPSKNITVIGVTGTKGKTSTAEITRRLFEAGGYKTALTSTLRIKIAGDSKPNLYKMTMPGRFFIHGFLRKAVDAGCDVAIIEMSSEGAKQFRHKFVELDGLIFTNISPEHIESHGSFENYFQAKLSLGKALGGSSKKKRVMVANSDDTYGKSFLDLQKITDKIGFSMNDVSNIREQNNITYFTFMDRNFSTKLIGRFNIYNIIASISMAKSFGVSMDNIVKAISELDIIKGRGERITLADNSESKQRQDFTVIVDYAHTPNSLEAIYQAFEHDKKICVLGNAGGGRDKWKRPEMGKIADTFCSHIILTDEDPYDEDPRSIVEEMKEVISISPTEIIMDRRKAIARAISLAKKDDVVIITGKGTDPYIMRANGDKEPWDDATVAREELEKRLNR